MKKRVEVQDATPQLVSVVLTPGSCPPGPCLLVTEALPLLSPEQLPAVSPDGRYAIVEIASDWEPRHTVFLEDRALKTQRKLFSYDQPESFLWNYDSKVFAVTDYANYIGNDSSVRSIFSVDENVPPVPVLDLLFRQLSESARENLKARLSNHHVNFVEALAWIKPMDLELKVSGYGDKDHASFAETYKLHVDLGHQ
jgi:hypothetical protein